MKYKLKAVMIVSILFSLTFLGLIETPLWAGGDKQFKADVVMALSNAGKIPGKIELIAWTHGGDIGFLDHDLSVIKKIKLPELSIRNILQVSGSLYILSEKKNKTGEIESIIVQYDIEKHNETHRWSDSNYYIWSISTDGHKAVAISSDGDLLELDSQGFKLTAKYPGKSHYLFTDEDAPIICTAPNLTKLKRKPAFCIRQNGFDWNRKGDWRNMAPPLICNNFLVEKNQASKGEATDITISNISSGRTIAEHEVKSLSNLTCIGNELAYASDSSIFVRSVPDFKVVHQLNTNSKIVNGVTRKGNTLYFIDKNGSVRKMELP